MDDRQFRIVLPDGSVSAPFGADALLSYAQAGHIGPQSQVFDHQANSWTAASGIDILQGRWPPGSEPAYTANAPAYTGNAPAHPENAPVYSAPPRVNRASIWLMGIGGVVALLALVIWGAMSYVLSGSPQSVTTADGLYSVTIPASWTKFPTGDPKIIDYTDVLNRSGFSAVRVTTYPVDSTGLTTIMSRLTDSVAKNIGGSATSSIQPATVAQYPALRQDFTGNIQGATCTFHEFLISTPDGAYQFNEVWQQGPDLSKGDVDKALQSFRRTPAGGAPKPAS